MVEQILFSVQDVNVLDMFMNVAVGVCVISCCILFMREQRQ
jgi:hypothetical protein